jgi:hypothetical protein
VSLSDLDLVWELVLAARWETGSGSAGKKDKAVLKEAELSAME